MAESNQENFHTISLDNIFKQFNSGEKGLSEKEAEERLNSSGRNEISKEEGKGIFDLILKEINSPLIYLLLAASFVSLLTDHYIDAAVILAVVIFNTFMGVIQEYRAESAIEALKKLSSPKASVIREGKEKVIDAAMVVPGDIVTLKRGDRVPADARVITSEQLEINESALTGESEAVRKEPGELEAEVPLAERSNMIFMSTPVTHGKGKVIVVATGMETVTGKIAAEVGKTVRETTPLQKKINRLGKFLGGAAIILAASIFLTGYLKGYDTFDMLLYSVAAAVSAIPEGLPAVISITLALGVRRMAKKNSIIRSLPAVETLGSTTVICSDKTGTITKNEMTVMKVFSANQIYQITGRGYEPEEKFVLEKSGEETSDYPEAIKKLMTIGALSNDSKLKKDDEGTWIIDGMPTDGAILVASKKIGIDGKDEKRLSEIPFSSELKYMAALYPSNGKNILYVKGAPERILSFCNKIHDKEGVNDLSEEDKEKIININKQFAGDALRVIAGAYKEFDKDKLENKDAESNLIFAGLWGIIDPPREEAIEAIKKCKSAGIRVLMLTGDNKETAAAIAADVGIAEKNSTAYTGMDVEKMDEDELGNAVANSNVFARVSPSHKLRILRALKKQNEIVAMTGDGVNDAPSLKGADIGIAMGITGTEVAKEAADMILTDDNFATIVKAIEEGRLMFNNLRHVIFFLVTTNLGEILLLISALLFSLPLPLTAVMILWVNLITDGPCAPAIGIEPKQRDLLHDKPRNPNAGILSNHIIIRMLILAPVMAAGTLLLFLYEMEINDYERARTVAFTTLAAFQWFNAFNARSGFLSIFTIGFFSNKWLIFAVSGAIILQLLVIYLPVGNTIFLTVPLNLEDWVLILSVSSSIFFVDEIRKIFVRRKYKHGAIG
jgi:P-type Ca2+ transporter type 2C